MNCFDQLKAALEAALAQYDASMTACGSDTECQANAGDKFAEDVEAAWAAYQNCSNPE